MRIIKPCPKCPYKLGLVQTPVSPCPQCKLDGYKMFGEFQKHIPERKPIDNKPK